MYVVLPVRLPTSKRTVQNSRAYTTGDIVSQLRIIDSQRLLLWFTRTKSSINDVVL